MFGYAVSALVTVLVGASQPERLQQWAQWGFGSFSGVTWRRLRLFAPLTVAGVLLAAATTKQLNALLLGDNYARSMGVAVRRARLLTMLGASVLGAVVTAFCGPISFLGIAVPHLCRGLLGTSDHRVLVPAVVLMGGAVALMAQIVSLLPGASGVLPLNAVTSLIGAPVVVMVLLRSRRGSVRTMSASTAGAGPAGARPGCRLSHPSHAPRGPRARQRGGPSRRAGLPARPQRHRQVDAAANAGADAAAAVGHGRARRRAARRALRRPRSPGGWASC